KRPSTCNGCVKKQALCSRINPSTEHLQSKRKQPHGDILPPAVLPFQKERKSWMKVLPARVNR
ncbi:MAG TPA: hypothetical protein VEP90_26370, partial [Methylomirabilota bacterium]|nr:hypothetical protein [Methylomirabilota bacterium]